MYFPIGWPKILFVPQKCREDIRHIVCNREKVLFAIITDDSIGIWFSKPCVQIINHRRSEDSLESLGGNVSAEWRTDSSMLVIVTSKGHLVFYHVDIDRSQPKTVYEQRDGKNPSLRRESAELFFKEPIPPLQFSKAFSTQVPGGITNVTCIRDELMVATENGHVERYKWDGHANLDYNLELARIPFSIDQEFSRAVPVDDVGVHVVDLEYSPVLRGFAVVLSDNRAALLTASSLKFDPNQVQGVWAQEIQDGTCCAVNHKYRLIAIGKKNGEAFVYNIDGLTGALQISHKLQVSSKDFSEGTSALGAVNGMKWSPDGCALALSWDRGGLSLWSVFGALLMCSWTWHSGSQDINRVTPLGVATMEWGAEGYQLWMGIWSSESMSRAEKSRSEPISLAQMNFLKSALTANPCMSNQEHVLLQGEDRLYVNAGHPVVQVWTRVGSRNIDNAGFAGTEDLADSLLRPEGPTLLGNKQWIPVMIPHTYTGTNWPIRYSAIDTSGQFFAVAGRTGVAHCCLPTRKWKLFGNETQERDFVVMGGLMWWRDHLLLGCYNVQEDRDEIRLYPRESKLDNLFVRVTKVAAPVLLIHLLRDRLVVFCADSHVRLYDLMAKEVHQNADIHLVKLQEVDVSNLSFHPACVTYVALTSRTETNSGRHSGHDVGSVLINVSGKLLMFQLGSSGSNRENGPDNGQSGQTPVYVTPTVLASCVETVWQSGRAARDKPHLVESLLLACGVQGMKIWLPLFPKDGERQHNFMSKRIMLPLNVHVYPLAVHFEDAVVLGAENDALFYPLEPSSSFSSLPFCVIERTSQVYLHHILRQLLRRNLGLHAWEIAWSCSRLPYFPHSLELLLHEVLEEEATSKEPIPDALLPRVVEFIQEFPVYLQTVVQCARKIEIALWPHLFQCVGNPKNLFQECLDTGHLGTASSYLLVLQNLEVASVSWQHATVLLNAALDRSRWELAKDLVRFLKAIDPDDVDSPPRQPLTGQSSARNSFLRSVPSIGQNDEDMSMVLGPVQGSRTRTFSLTGAPKSGQQDNCANSGNRELYRTTSDPKVLPLQRLPSTGKDSVGSSEEFFLDVILQHHARKLLVCGRLKDLGSFAAHLDFHLVSWLKKERNRAAHVEDFVSSLKQVHKGFQWSFPVPPHLPVACCLQPTVKVLPAGCASAQPADEVNDNGDMAGYCNSKQIGDSGYLSNHDVDARVLATVDKESLLTPANLSLTTVPLTATPAVNGVTLEAHLMPHAVQDEGSLRTVDLSEDNSVWGDGDLPLDDENWATLTFDTEIEHLSQELASRGPHKSEVQLRYLLQLMMEAGCLEWALIIAVVLRDAIAVVRTINSAKTADDPQDVTLRLKEGMATLERWASSECLGYKPFLNAVHNQSVALTKMSWTKLRHGPPSSTSSLNSPTQSLENSPVQEDIWSHPNNATVIIPNGPNADKCPLNESRDVDRVNANNSLPKHPRNYECAIS